MRLSLPFLLSSLSVVVHTQAAPHQASPNLHQRRLSTSLNPGDQTEGLAEVIGNSMLVRKGNSFDNVRLTYYDTSTGLGSCGNYNAPSKYTFALNSAQYEQYGGGYPNSKCGAWITLTVDGKTTQAEMQDECPGCPYGGLDLSEGLFTFFADTGAGVLSGSWFWNDDAPSSPTTSTTSKTSTTYTPIPTSTYTPPTSTYTPPPATTSSATPTPTSTSTPQPTSSSTSSSTVLSSTSVFVAPSTASSTSTLFSSSSTVLFNSSSIVLSSTIGRNSTALVGQGASSTEIVSSTAAGPAVSAGVNVGNQPSGGIEMVALLVNALGGVVCRGNQQCQ